ncbi:hypothetical protein U1Q18_001022 [Sarracenia purpurea var. burkii]
MLKPFGPHTEFFQLRILPVNPVAGDPYFPSRLTWVIVRVTPLRPFWPSDDIIMVQLPTIGGKEEEGTGKFPYFLNDFVYLCDDMAEKGRPLPKFGEWDVNDPTSAEGFTAIFNKARDEKKTGGNPESPTKEEAAFRHGATLGKPQSKKWFCCM